MVVHSAPPRGGLALTRRRGEAIVIDTGEGLITVRLIDLKKGRARLHIDAPRHVPVDREEVFAAKRKVLTA